MGEKGCGLAAAEDLVAGDNTLEFETANIGGYPSAVSSIDLILALRNERVSPSMSAARNVTFSPHPQLHRR